MPRPSKHWDRLSGRTAIVTGAGAVGGVGVGKAISLLFAAEGAALCLVDKEAERVHETCAEIEADGGSAIAVVADVTDDAACQDIVANAVGRFGRLDILVNNVGVSNADSSMDAWDRLMAVNLRSAVVLSQAAIARMAPQGAGVILNIGSIGGMRAHGDLAYGPSKAALAQLAREIAVMYGRQGIRANTIAPGHIMTPHVADLIGESARAERRNVAPLGVEGDAWDVAHAAVFLASDEARFLTGLLLPVDGGVTEIGPLKAHAMLASSDAG